MYSKIRLFFTLLLWAITAAIIIHLLSADAPDRTTFENTVGLMFAALGIAIGGTFFILIMPDLLIEDLQVEAQKHGGAIKSAKAKREGGSRREDQLAVLLELMDEDEREMFQERLRQRMIGETGYADGELPDTGETLDSLLAEEVSARRLRGER